MRRRYRSDSPDYARVGRLLDLSSLDADVLKDAVMPAVDYRMPGELS
jgi:hypothetical protein